jgi:hypothetical protein
VQEERKTKQEPQPARPQRTHDADGSPGTFAVNGT